MAAIRPYHVHYYDKAPSEGHMPAKKSACTTERNAIRAAIGRIFDEEFVHAIIYDMRLEAPVRFIRRSGRGRKRSFESGFGSGVGY